MKSIIYSISKEELQIIINNSKTYGQILKHFGLENRGANPKTLKKRIREECLDDSSITKNLKFGGGWNKGTNGIILKRMSLEDAMKKIFVLDSNFRGLVRGYVRYYHLIDEKCSECGLGTMWNNKPLVLELDHIDGNAKNNELKNLRWLCGNCHSQTNTFRGRKNRIKYFCECGKEIWKTSKKCGSCTAKLQPRKVERPDKETLSRLIQENSFVRLGKMFGVTDNAIRKWCESYDIPYRRGG